MYDQAATLRAMVSNRAAAVRQKKVGRRCIAITGGKGGVGKTNLAVNLALELGALREHVALLDADFGLANVDLMCGVTPKFHLGHVVANLKPLDEITISLSDYVSLIPAGSGIEEMANFSLSTRPHMFARMRRMEAGLDFMLIDTAAGIAENVSGVVDSASEIIVVVTPEPTSIVDAYATIKLILRRSPSKPISIVINNVVGTGEGEQVFNSIGGAVRGFLDQKIDFLGMVPSDPLVPEAVREQVPVVRYAPGSPASRAIRLIAKQLHSQRDRAANSIKARSFWDQLAKIEPS